ncbi:MAG TPA: SRPBCC family protein [Micromonosporaceae bacterium]
MAVTQRVVNASPAQVWAVLADGWTYSDWVVGTAHIRGVDPAWPRPGSRIYHKAGPWPLSLRDRSTSLSADEPRCLELTAGLWPLGEAKVRLELAPTPTGGTRITMHESFEGGSLRWMRTKIHDLLLHGRNVEALRRLGDLAAGRPHRVEPPSAAAGAARSGRGPDASRTDQA